MNSLQPSPEWEVLLKPFQSLFTKPGFRCFRAFVFVFAHLDGRLRVTQVILSNLLQRHFTNFHRFLESRAWSLAAVRQQVFTLCLPVCQEPQGRVFAAKYGKHFDAAGLPHDPMNRQHPKQLS